jgi:hypothetical protein
MSRVAARQLLLGRLARAIRGGATVMDDVFNDDEDDPGEGNKKPRALRHLAWHLILGLRSDNRWS